MRAARQTRMQFAVYRQNPVGFCNINPGWSATDFFSNFPKKFKKVTPKK
jgi:hypothetical protein